MSKSIGEESLFVILKKGKKLTEISIEVLNFRPTHSNRLNSF